MSDTAAIEGLARRHRQITWGLLGFAALLLLLRPFLPDWLIRLPEAAVLPWEPWIDAIFSWLQNDLGLMEVTRTIADWLGFLINAAANLLYGKSRWPRFEAIPWSAVAAVAGMIGYHLGGWRLALLAAGTCVYAAMMGQWKWTMEMMSVIVVAAPVSFTLGLLAGIAAWKWKRFERVVRPALAVLQTLPFLSYLLPAVIFFKVGPTAAAVATIMYALPPMVLLTNIGLKKVPPEVVEAGKMAGCSRWQMLRHVYIPSARTEILVGLNQVIMLSLAMVVLTAFIGMPGLGAKLLAMMNSFKLGRSLEIGITIVLVAVVLDRLTKAWVLKQPVHFERGTPWWKRNLPLLSTLGLFVVFVIVGRLSDLAPHYKLGDFEYEGGAIGHAAAWVKNIGQYTFSVLGEVHRSQDWSMGKPIDSGMKHWLGLDGVKAVTGAIRVTLNLYVLLPTERFLVYLPTLAVMALITAACFRLGGRRPAIISLIFFAIVAEFGWWDRAMLTMHSTLIAVLLSLVLGIPLGIWVSRGDAPRMSLRNDFDELAIGIIGLIFRRIPIAVGALILSGVIHYGTATEGAAAFLSPRSPSLYVYGVAFALLWLGVRNMSRDRVMMVVVDTAQTFPSFIYLLPAIMLFGITSTTVILSILIYTMVPVVRYTMEGLRAVPPEMVEAAEMSGATRMQKLFKVQLPLAMPIIAVGLNQALMFAFFMVIIAAFIGTRDLGQELQRTMAGTLLGKNFVLGFSVVFMALTFDIATNAWAERRRQALGLS